MEEREREKGINVVDEAVLNTLIWTSTFTICLAGVCAAAGIVIIRIFFT